MRVRKLQKRYYVKILSLSRLDVGVLGKLLRNKENISLYNKNDMQQMISATTYHYPKILDDLNNGKAYINTEDFKPIMQYCVRFKNLRNGEMLPESHVELYNANKDFLCSYKRMTVEKINEIISASSVDAPVLFDLSGAYCIMEKWGWVAKYGEAYCSHLCNHFCVADYTGIALFTSNSPPNECTGLYLYIDPLTGKEKLQCVRNLRKPESIDNYSFIGCEDIQYLHEILKAENYPSLRNFYAINNFFNNVSVSGFNLDQLIEMVVKIKKELGPGIKQISATPNEMGVGMKEESIFSIIFIGEVSMLEFFLFRMTFLFLCYYFSNFNIYNRAVCIEICYYKGKLYNKLPWLKKVVHSIKQVDNVNMYLDR